jgi:hypothetical protein
MENKPATKQNPSMQSEQQIEQQSYSISEITAKYKKLNEDLVDALDQLNMIFNVELLDSSDIKIFKKLNITFKKLQINEDELNTHGESIFTQIIETVFEESIDKAKELFSFNDPDFWYIKLDVYNKLIIKIGVEVSFTLKFLNELFNSLITIASLSECVLDDESDRFNAYNDADTMNYFDFEETVKKAIKIIDLQDRLNFYHSEIAEKELYGVQYNEDSFVLEMCTDFTHRCNRAIEITENLLNKSTKHKLETPVKPIEINQWQANQASEINTQAGNNETSEVELLSETTGKPNTEFTTSRQVLAMYYLLNEIDHKSVNNIDRTEKARFIEFLTGKNYDNIYKTLSKPFKGLDSKNPKTILKDMEYVTNHFEKLGLQSIVTKIKNDMEN